MNPASPVVVCADVGSTDTKVAAVDVEAGTLAATASHRSTVDTDVLDGLDAACAELAAALPGTDLSEIRVCSSAGGGLRLAVVGYEALVTAEAGHRVGLSAGAQVVHVAAGPLAGAGVRTLLATAPDVVLLVGGTDGGDEQVLRHNAARLAASRLRVPVVLAGNSAARADVERLLTGAGKPVVATANVLPRIGALRPQPARDAIREVFLAHVIGGKGLSAGRRFAELVRAPTPDAVLTAVELLAEVVGGDVLAVDVGGATTDVYSVREAGASSDVAGALWHARTVEGDLGVRWNVPGIVAAARAERLLGPAEETAADLRLTELAAVVALRRHARGDRERRDHRDLTGVRLVVGSGGVLRHAAPRHARELLARVVADHTGGWPLPRAARLAVDTDYLLAPAGLLAADHPAAAARLLGTLADAGWFDTPDPTRRRRPAG